MLHSRTVVCWKRHKRLVTPLFWNDFSAITSLSFVVDQKEQHFWNQWIFLCVPVYMHNFQFSWWSHDDFFGTLQGSISAKCLVTDSPDYQKTHLQSLGFPSVPLVWGKTVSCRLRRIVEGYPKTWKMLFLDLALPTLQNSGIFHDNTRPHLHSDGLHRNRGDSSSLHCVHEKSNPLDNVR